MYNYATAPYMYMIDTFLLPCYLGQSRNRGLPSPLGVYPWDQPNTGPTTRRERGGSFTFSGEGRESIHGVSLTDYCGSMGGCLITFSYSRSNGGVSSPPWFVLAPPPSGVTFLGESGVVVVIWLRDLLLLLVICDPSLYVCLCYASSILWLLLGFPIGDLPVSISTSSTASIRVDQLSPIILSDL